MGLTFTVKREGGVFDCVVGGGNCWLKWPKGWLGGNRLSWVSTAANGRIGKGWEAAVCNSSSGRAGQNIDGNCGMLCGRVSTWSREGIGTDSFVFKGVDSGPSVLGKDR